MTTPTPLPLDATINVNDSGHVQMHSDVSYYINLRLPVAQTLTVSGSVTIDASLGDAAITLQANATSSSIINGFAGQVLRVTWIEDATGGRTYAWPANCKFAGGSAPNFTTGSHQSTATFRFDGTNWQELSRAVGVG